MINMINEVKLSCEGCLEDVLGVHKAKPRLRGLQVVDGLPHVAIRREQERLKSVVCIRRLH